MGLNLHYLKAEIRWTGGIFSLHNEDQHFLGGIRPISAAGGHRVVERVCAFI